MIPSKAGREFIVRGVSALGHSPGWLAVTAGLIAPLGATLVAFRVNPTARLPYPSSLIITDSSMAVISIMVKRGDLWGDTANRNLLPLRPTGGFDGIASVFGARAAPRTSGVRPIRALLRHQRFGRSG